MIKPPPNRACRSCGLASGLPHGTTQECVDALQHEVDRLRERVQTRRTGRTASFPSTSDGAADARRTHHEQVAEARVHQLQRRLDS